MKRMKQAADLVVSRLKCQAHYGWTITFFMESVTGAPYLLDRTDSRCTSWDISICGGRLQPGLSAASGVSREGPLVQNPISSAQDCAFPQALRARGACVAPHIDASHHDLHRKSRN